MTLLIADDHTVFREGLSVLLLQMPGITRVIEASNGQEVLDLLATETIDLVLMDISMPVKNGVETLNELRKGKYAELPVIALTMSNHSADILSLHKSGVNGYLLKNSAVSEVWEAILKVKNGGVYYSAAVKELLQERKENNLTLKDELTNREKEILKMICQEMSSEEIAQRLFLSTLTVNNHRRNILVKTGAKNVAGLVFYALKNGIYREER